VIGLHVKKKRRTARLYAVWKRLVGGRRKANVCPRGNAELLTRELCYFEGGGAKNVRLTNE